MSTKSTISSKPSKIGFIAELRQLLAHEQIIEHGPLGRFTSTGLGGVADYIVVAKTTEELLAVVKLAIRHQQTYAVLGGGTGTLISEVGFPGLVISNQTSSLSFDQRTSQMVCDSGLTNNQLVNTAVTQGLGGLEFLAAIPGTIGGAVVSGATWHDKSIRSFVKEIVVYVPDKDGGKVTSVTTNQLPSPTKQPIIFAESKQPPVILTIRLQLARLNETEIRRRLVAIRRAQSFKIGPQLGYTFVPSLVEAGLPLADLKRLRLPAGVTLDRQEPDIITLKNQPSAASVRTALDQIIELANYYGTKLECRLTFLGYWPDKEGNADTPNA